MLPTTKTMTDAEKYLHQKELNRLRQKKYYDAHKATLLGVRKQDRQAIKEVTQEENPTIDMLPSNQTFLQKFEISLAQSKDITDISKKNFITHIKTFMRITECDNLELCLKKPKEIIKLIEEASQKSKIDGYATNSKKSFIEAVLKAITTLKIKLPVNTIKAYKNYFEQLKATSHIENAKKKVDEKVEDFNKYLDNIKTVYGENSKEYVLCRLYDEVTLRDDFYLKIIKVIKDNTDPKQNYIVLPPSGQATLFINDYKTVGKYEPMRFTLSTDLSKLLRNYMKLKKLNYGDFLFGNAKLLSDFVSKMNKKMGLDGGSITYFRKMKISQILQGENINDVKKRVELAERMGHSPAIQLRYLREINIL